MKVKTLSALAGFGAAMILSSAAQADLLAGPAALSVEVVPPGGAGAPPGPRIIYNVFANFTAGSDRVLTWGIGGTNLGAGGIENITALQTPGTGFTNAGAAGANAPPSSPGGARDWDTYATLGVRYGEQVTGGDGPGYSPGFPNFVTGTALTVPLSGMAVFIAPEPTNVIGRADFINSGADTATRVLLMQLVVNVGEHVRGTIGVVWDGAGAPDGTVASGLTFNSVPAPGALALLGLAGLVGSRRRRA